MADLAKLQRWRERAAQAGNAADVARLDEKIAVASAASAAGPPDVVSGAGRPDPAAPGLSVRPKQKPSGTYTAPQNDIVHRALDSLRPSTDIRKAPGGVAQQVGDEAGAISSLIADTATDAYSREKPGTIASLIQGGPAASRPGNGADILGTLYDLAPDFIKQMGGGSDTPGVEALKDRAEMGVARTARGYSMGLTDRGVGAEPGADTGQAAELERLQNEYSGTGLAGDIGGSVLGGIFGPARLIAGGLGRLAGRVAPQALKTAAAANPMKTAVLENLGTGTAINVGQNAIEGQDLGANLGVNAVVSMLSPVAGAFASKLNRTLRGHPDAPSVIGEYRDAVDEGRYQYEKPVESIDGGDFPQPQDVRRAGTEQGRPAEMANAHEASHYAASKALHHREDSSEAVLDALEEQMAPYQEIGVAREGMIADIRRQLAENRARGLGEVDPSLGGRLRESLQRLEENAPAGIGRAPEVAAGEARDWTAGRVASREGRFAEGSLTGTNVNPNAGPMAQEGLPLPAVKPQKVTPERELELPRAQRERTDRSAYEGPFKQGPMQDRMPFATYDAPLEPSRVVEGGERTVTGHPGHDYPWRRPDAPEFTERQMAAAPSPRSPALTPGQQMSFVQDPTVTPGIEASGGVGPYQMEMGIPEPRLPEISIEEALSYPTIGGLRRLRAQARQRAQFSSRDVTDQMRDARAEYFIWDKAIKDAAPPEYLAIEAEMAQQARKYRRAGDLMTKSEGAVTGGPALEDLDPVTEADDLGAMVRENADPTIRVGRQLQTSRALRRVGDVNDPGLDIKPYLEELSTSDPEAYGKLLQMVRDVKVREAVRPGIKVRMPRDFTGAQGKFAGTSISLMEQNLNALAGRLGIPVMELVTKLAPKAGQLSATATRSPVDAIMAGKKQQKEEKKKQAKGR